MGIEVLAPDVLMPIRQRFLSMLEDYTIQISILHEDAEDPAELAEAMADIGSIAHRVAGVAATLGYEPLGVVASRLDQQLVAGRQRGSCTLEENDHLIRLFRAAINNALDGSAT